MSNEEEKILNEEEKDLQKYDRQVQKELHKAEKYDKKLTHYEEKALKEATKELKHERHEEVKELHEIEKEIEHQMKDAGLESKKVEKANEKELHKIEQDIKHKLSDKEKVESKDAKELKKISKDIKAELKEAEYDKKQAEKLEEKELHKIQQDVRHKMHDQKKLDAKREKLAEESLEELQKIAKVNGIKNYSTLHKDELIDLIIVSGVNRKISKEDLLNSKTVEELHAIAKERHLKDYSTLSKAELVELLLTTKAKKLSKKELLELKTVEELHEMAAESGVEGYFYMKKDELIKIILKNKNIKIKADGDGGKKNNNIVSEKFAWLNKKITKPIAYTSMALLAAAGIAIAVAVPLVQEKEDGLPHATYGQGVYFDDYHYVPETAHNHIVYSTYDDETSDVVGEVYYQSNLWLNTDGQHPDYGEALFDEEEFIDSYAWVNPFLIGSSSRYNSSVLLGYLPNGYVSSAGEGSYSNDVVELDAFNTITEYYFSRYDEQEDAIMWYSLEYIEQYEVTRMFDTNNDDVKDSGIEIVLDEALVLFNNYSGETIGYFNLDKANLYIDGEEINLLKADELTETEVTTLKDTINTWTYWGAGSPSDPATTYLGTVEGALALFAINASVAGLDASEGIYSTYWNNDPWFEVTNEDYSEDETNFNDMLVTLDAATKAEAMTKL